MYQFFCGRCNAANYGQTCRHLSIRDDQHSGVSLFCVKKQNSVASVFIIGPQFPKHALDISIKI